MEFGKPENPAVVDWTLNPDTELTSYVLKQLQPKQNNIPSVYIGSTSWGDKAYLGEVYPPKTKAKEYLEAYATQFNTIELNTTFYRMPTAVQCGNWAAKTPSDFKFCPKVNKLLSQSKNLGVGTNRIDEFCEGVRGFEQKLGPCFIQLPSHFDSSKLSALLSFFDHWPSDLQLAIELRHPSWFEESNGADLFAELVARNLGTTISDVGGRRDVAHMNITTDFFLLRWVGNNHTTDQARVEDWSTRISNWLLKGLEDVYVFTHQPLAPASAKTATVFEKLLKLHHTTPLKVRAPKALEKPQDSGIQSELFG